MLDATDWLPMGDGHGGGHDETHKSLHGQHEPKVPFCFGKWAEEVQVRAGGMDLASVAAVVAVVAIASAVVVVVAVGGGVAACIDDAAVVASSPSVGDGALCNVDPDMERLSPSSWVSSPELFLVG